MFLKNLLPCMCVSITFISHIYNRIFEMDILLTDSLLTIVHFRFLASFFSLIQGKKQQKIRAREEKQPQQREADYQKNRNETREQPLLPYDSSDGALQVAGKKEKNEHIYSLIQTREKRKDQQFRYVIERKFFSTMRLYEYINRINWQSFVVYLVSDNYKNI